MHPPGRYEITIERGFSATHALKLPDGTWEPVHGHDWPVWVTVAADELDAMRTVMDFHELERVVEGVIRPWHGKHLNDIPPFKGDDMNANPSAERVAWAIAAAVEKQLRGQAWLVSVKIGEAKGCTATYCPGRTPHVFS